MKISLGRFSPRKETNFFSQTRKVDFPGLKVFLQHMERVELRYAVSVQTGTSVERNAVKRELRAWLLQNSKKLQHKKIFIIVLNWQKAKQNLEKIIDLV